MSEMALAAVGLCIFFYALLERRLASTIVTAPMVFIGAGLLLNSSGLAPLKHAEHALHILAEVTLIVLLFTDASIINFRALRRRTTWPLRMLFGGMPLSILLGVVVGALFLPSWPIAEVALLAAILAPTDAALGQAVVTNQKVSERVRETLSVESGVNDGLALPAVLMFACIAVGGVHESVQTNWFVFAIQQLGFGALTGAFVCGLGGLAMRWSLRRGYSSDALEGVGALALAGLCYLLANEVGGNGFIAAFTGGLAFGVTMQKHSTFVFEFMETEGQLLILGTFLLLGASVAPHALAHVELSWIALIAASLLFVRPAAIWISLWRTDAKPLTKAFMGWFGPRGLATALFALLVIDGFDTLPHRDEILSISVLAVLISAVVHGITAAPGARWFAARETTTASSDSYPKKDQA